MHLCACVLKIELSLLWHTTTHTRVYFCYVFFKRFKSFSTHIISNTAKIHNILIQNHHTAPVYTLLLSTCVLFSVKGCCRKSLRLDARESDAATSLCWHQVFARAHIASQRFVGHRGLQCAIRHVPWPITDCLLKLVVQLHNRVAMLLLHFFDGILKLLLKPTSKQNIV